MTQQNFKRRKMAFFVICKYGWSFSFVCLKFFFGWLKIKLKNVTTWKIVFLQRQNVWKGRSKGIRKVTQKGDREKKRADLNKESGAKRTHARRNEARGALGVSTSRSVVLAASLGRFRADRLWTIAPMIRRDFAKFAAWFNHHLSLIWLSFSDC